MKTHVTFLAEGFNQTEHKPNFINDDNFGEDVAQWIIAKLKNHRDISADPEPVQEDCGWLLQISTDQFSGDIGLGSYQVGTSTGEKHGWLCFWKAPRKNHSCSLERPKPMNTMFESKKPPKRYCGGFTT
jgi:hypothetical protein